MKTFVEDEAVVISVNGKYYRLVRDCGDEHCSLCQLRKLCKEQYDNSHSIPIRYIPIRYGTDDIPHCVSSYGHWEEVVRKESQDGRA